MNINLLCNKCMWYKSMHSHLACVMRSFSCIICVSFSSFMRAYVRIRLLCEHVRLCVSTHAMGMLAYARISVCDAHVSISMLGYANARTIKGELMRVWYCRSWFSAVLMMSLSLVYRSMPTEMTWEKVATNWAWRQGMLGDVLLAVSLASPSRCHTEQISNMAPGLKTVFQSQLL